MRLSTIGTHSLRKEVVTASTNTPGNPKQGQCGFERVGVWNQCKEDSSPLVLAATSLLVVLQQ
ncbi:hypothetical protein H257_19554, partial [Aphanomyces astaci]